MFDVPRQYATDDVIEPKTFMTRNMRKVEKDRISENLLLVRLNWQIAGEEIPSRIDTDYNCMVIMGFDVKLKNIKDNAYFSELIQHMIKAPCVVRFNDNTSESYSFAHKRLSQTDTSQIVIIDRVDTPTESIAFPGKVTTMLKRHIEFDRIKNMSDKLNLYLEATIKAYIISNLSLFSGMERLLDSKVWYNQMDMLALFEQLKTLKRLSDELKAEKLPGERAQLNEEISKIIGRFYNEINTNC